MSVRSIQSVLVGVGVVALITGCSLVARGVGPQPTPITLTLAAAFDANTELQPFVDAVTQLSDGAVQIEYKGGVHAGEDATENSLLDDVAAGTYDMTWTAQRPRPARGNEEFDALVAPFLIDSYALERAVLKDPIADQMTASVSGNGLVGIGIAPGPLRTIAAHKPVVKPADLTGSVVGIDDTWVGAATVKALGGTTAFPTNDNLATLTGAVAQLLAIVGNRWDVELPNVSAETPFWPRPVIVVMNEARFNALSDAQRQALHDGLKASIARRAEQLKAEDDRAVEAICAIAQIPVASDDDRSALRAAAAPVYEQLNGDPATASYIARIDVLKATMTPALPYACDGSAVTGSQSPALGIPDGTYRIALTADEVNAWIRANNVPADAQLAFKAKDCPCSYSFKLHGTDLIGDDGDPWKVSYFGGDHVSIGDTIGTYGFRWSFANDQLTLSDITGAAWADAEVWTIKPWKRDH